jgi:hypothetical protein
MTVHLWTRAILILLALVEGIVALWATLWPQSFFDDGPVPGLDTGWVALFPPYNEHLMRDYGSALLGLVLVTVVAAVKMTPTLIRTSMGAMLMFAVPHTIFHLLHLEHFTPADAITQSITLVLTALLPVAVIVMAGKLDRGTGGGPEGQGGGKNTVAA